MKRLVIYCEKPGCGRRVEEHIGLGHLPVGFEPPPRAPSRCIAIEMLAGRCPDYDGPLWLGGPTA